MPGAITTDGDSFFDCDTKTTLPVISRQTPFRKTFFHKNSHSQFTLFVNRGVFFTRTISEFLHTKSASTFCQIPLIHQAAVAPPAPRQEAQLALVSVEPLIASLNSKLESVPALSPKSELPLPTPTPAMSPALQNLSASNLPIPEITEGAHSPFALQIGAFQRRAEAEARVAQIKRKGEKARIIKAEITDKGVWYRVQMGNFNECAAAISYGQQLQAGKKLTEFIITDYQNPGQ